MSEQSKEVNEKKTIYKKWWFWLVIVILGIAIIGGAGGSNPDNNDKNTDTEQGGNITDADEWYKSGTYKVGTDIKAGEYLVESTGWNCYIEVNKDSSGTFDSIVSNDNVSTRTYINLLDGQYFEISGGKFIEVSKSNSYQPENGIYKEGMYKVGKDIQPGEYKITADDSNCYIEVDKNSFHIFDSIISNDNIALGETTYITVSAGQYLTVKGGTFTKVN